LYEINLRRVKLHESFVSDGRFLRNDAIFDHPMKGGKPVGFCAKTQFPTTLSSGGRRSDFAQGRNFRPPYQVGADGRILRRDAIFDHPMKGG